MGKRTLKRYKHLGPSFNSWHDLEQEVRNLFEGVENAVSVRIIQSDGPVKKIEEPDAEQVIGYLHKLIPNPRSRFELYLFLTVAEVWE